MYNYTKPRMPIAAMYNSPGPAYGLPGLMGQVYPHDPRSVHFRGPAFPFGIKNLNMANHCSPGPCHHPGYGMYRDGRAGIPCYSIADRPKDAPQNKSPGPAAYAPEKQDMNAHTKAPAYTFGSRGKFKNTDKTPGPNAYTLDPMLSKTTRSSKPQAPCYSMVWKHHHGGFGEDLAGTPGPSAYGSTATDLYKMKPPQYTMVFKHMIPGETTQKPGPGAHSPEKVISHKPIQPSFSFGIKHSSYTTPLIVDSDV